MTADRETGGSQKPHVLVWANTAAASSLGLQKLSWASILVSLPHIITSMDIWPATSVFQAPARSCCVCVYYPIFIHDTG